MNTFTMQMLQEIATAAKTIEVTIGKIVGFECGEHYNKCANMHSEHTHNSPLKSLPLKNSIIRNEVQESISHIKEIKQMLIELTIKGSVRQRQNGLIELRTQAFGSIYGRTKAEIEQKLNQKINAPKNKLSTKKKTTPLLSKFYRDNYLPYKVNQNLAERTLKRLDGTFNFIMCRKFDKALTAYKPQEIEEFLYSIKETRKRQIVQGFFNNLFKRAVATSTIKISPSASIEKTKHIAKVGRAFSFEEQKIFFEYLFIHSNLPYNYICYYIFVYLTGTRRNEALASKPNDVNFHDKVLQINGTKTAGSFRCIPLFPLVDKLLRSLPNKDKKYFQLSEYNADTVFHKCIKQLNIDHKLHDLRHTFGTIQICCNKVDIKTVSLYMGHSTVDTTLQIYTHPEQLDQGTFLRGDLKDSDKIDIYQKKYQSILELIDNYISKNTQNIPKKNGVF